jgi:hypothetical protein
MNERKEQEGKERKKEEKRQKCQSQQCFCFWKVELLGRNQN